jgi:hypothetical protein
MRKFHPSLVDEFGNLKVNPVTQKTLYDESGDDVKGHDPECAWEGYLSVEKCGCKASSPR